MTEEKTRLSFKERLALAAGDVAYLEKRGYNAHFKYAFVSEADVKAGVSKALRAHGLVVSGIDTQLLSDPNNIKTAVVRVQVAIHDQFGPEYVTSYGIGGGSDSSDKAPMKATAAALKYALTSLFLIETGDDPEQDGGKKPGTEAPSKPQAGKGTSPAPTGYAAILEAVKAAKTLTELEALRPALATVTTHKDFVTEMKVEYVKRKEELK